MGRLWAIVYVGNLLGTTAFALLIAWAGSRLEVIDPAAVIANR